MPFPIHDNAPTNTNRRFCLLFCRLAFRLFLFGRVVWVFGLRVLCFLINTVGGRRDRGGVRERDCVRPRGQGGRRLRHR